MYKRKISNQIIHNNLFSQDYWGIVIVFIQYIKYLNKVYWIRQDEIVIVESISKSILIVADIAIIDLYKTALQILQDVSRVI